MVRMTVGTHQDHGSRQASASFITRKKLGPPDGFQTSVCDEDINTIVTTTSPAAIHTGPITRAHTAN
jgi:hypothetical protein